MNTISGISRFTVADVWLPRSGLNNAVSGSDAVTLAGLTQQMAAAAVQQMQHTNIDALFSAFEQLRDAVWQLHDVSAHVVRLDVEGLMQLCRGQLQDGEVAVLQDIPSKLYELCDEVCELHVNCSRLRGFDDWLFRMPRLAALYLDGDASFAHKHVVEGKVFAESFHDSWPLVAYTQRMSQVRHLQLPESMYQLTSLTKLSLCNMPGLDGLPNSFASMTNITALCIRKCPNFSNMYNMGDMPLLRQLVVDGELCRRILPDPQVRRWPLQDLQLSDCDAVRMGEFINSDADDMIKLLTALRTSLQSLLLGECCLPDNQLAAVVRSFPYMPALSSLRLQFGTDTFVLPCRLPLASVPAIRYLDGVTTFDEELHMLPNLQHLRVFATVPLPLAFGAPMLHMQRLELTVELSSYLVLHDVPEWLCGQTFPNLSSLSLSHCTWLGLIPPSFATFTALTELTLFRMQYFGPSRDTGIMIDPSILQMSSLRTVNFHGCDFHTLPPLVLHALEFMRISDCSRLAEIPALYGAALPKLAILQLHNLPQIMLLPATLGELTALRGLYVDQCALKCIPASIQALSELRELVIAGDPSTPQSQLIPEIALCLPALRGLRKLCLPGLLDSNALQHTRDVVAIGLALRAFPLPLLDPMDVKFPMLG